MSTEARWSLVTAGGEEAGPYTDDEIRSYAGEGRITPDCHLWAEGLENWIRADQVEGLFPAPEPRRPKLVTGVVPQTAPVQATAPVGPSTGIPGSHPVQSHQVSAPGAALGVQPGGQAIHPAFVGPLRTVSVGLGFLLWGTWGTVVGLVLMVLGATFGMFGSDGALVAILMIAGAVIMLVSYVLKIIGISISIAVPSPSGAKGFIIAALCCEVVGLLVSLIGLPVGGWASMAALILIAVFLRNLAGFVNNTVLAIEGRSLIIHSSILAGLSVVTPVAILLIFGAGILALTGTGSFGAGFGMGLILTIVLAVIILFFFLSVLLKSISLIGELRRSLRQGCFAAMAAQRHGLAVR